MDSLSLLKLLHLAGSALPIGAAAHSFGLETLAAQGILEARNLEAFLPDWLHETGRMEAVFLRAAWRGRDFAALNRMLAARKLARESRAASVALGRRFLRLAANLQPAPELLAALEATPDAHLAIAFGLAARVCGITEDSAAPAYLQQAVTALVSACQRLMPLGQSRATELLWDLQPAIAEVAEASAHASPEEVAGFAPLLDLASMRHPSLETRLFIS